MTKNVSIAEGLVQINATDAHEGHSNVTLASTETPETHTLVMPDGALQDMLAIAEHPDGEPEGVDLTAAYERLELLLEGCPAGLRPIP